LIPSRAESSTGQPSFGMVIWLLVILQVARLTSSKGAGNASVLVLGIAKDVGLADVLSCLLMRIQVGLLAESDLAELTMMDFVCLPECIAISLLLPGLLRVFGSVFGDSDGRVIEILVAIGRHLLVVIV
jgi:hypothetical protein